MTSMPASRSARAMIFAPRSWPSRPGFAISTRIFFCIINRYHYAPGFAKPGPSVCQTVAAGRVGELEVSVPLWFDRFDEYDMLAARLADNLQDISPGQGPESEVPSTVRGFPAHCGLPDFIQYFFESEAVFCIRKIVVSRQSGASQNVLTLRGENAGVCVLFLLVLLLQVRERSSQALLLLFRHIIERHAGARERHRSSVGTGHGRVAGDFRSFHPDDDNYRDDG